MAINKTKYLLSQVDGKKCFCTMGKQCAGMIKRVNKVEPLAAVEEPLADVVKSLAGKLRPQTTTFKR